MTEFRWCVNRMWLTPYFLLNRGCPRCSPVLVLYRWMLSSSLAVTSRFSVRWKSSELMVAPESCCGMCGVSGGEAACGCTEGSETYT